MSVVAKTWMKLSTDETVSTGLDHGDSSETVTHNLHVSASEDHSTINATSTPPATKVYSDEITLVAGDATIDLTSLAGPFGTSIDFTDLKIAAIHIIAASTNTEKVKIYQGAANPFYLWGEVLGAVWLWPGDEILIRCSGNSTDQVTAIHCELDITSNDADAKCSFHLVAG